MPALVKRVTPIPVRLQSKSLNPHEVKRLGPGRRISTKRVQSQSIQTETVLACLEHQRSVETQTIDEEKPGFATRLIQFFGGTIVSFMKFFKTS